MFAVIKSGGKQYKVSQDMYFSVEKLDAEAGSLIVMKDVLMYSAGDDVKINPENANVELEILEHYKGKKLIVFKNRRRHTYRRKNGHRQNYTRVKVLKISCN